MLKSQSRKLRLINRLFITLYNHTFQSVIDYFYYVYKPVRIIINIMLKYIKINNYQLFTN